MKRLKLIFYPINYYFFLLIICYTKQICITLKELTYFVIVKIENKKYKLEEFNIKVLMKKILNAGIAHQIVKENQFFKKLINFQIT